MLKTDAEFGTLHRFTLLGLCKVFCDLPPVGMVTVHMSVLPTWLVLPTRLVFRYMNGHMHLFDDRHMDFLVDRNVFNHWDVFVYRNLFDVVMVHGVHFVRHMYDHVLARNEKVKRVVIKNQH